MKFIKTIFLIPIFIVALYGLAWGGLYLKLSHEINALYQNTSDDLEFLGPQPSISGFPFEPLIIFQDGIKLDTAEIRFSNAYIQTSFIPYLPFKIHFPQGLDIKNKAADFNIDYFSIEGPVPYPIPSSFYREDLERWHIQDGEINIDNFNLRVADLTATGTGYVSLDKNLQPNVLINTQLSGYTSYIQSLASKNIVKPFVGFAAIAALNAVSRQEPNTGEVYANVPVSIKNQRLFVKDLQLVRLPEIRWDRRN